MHKFDPSSSITSSRQSGTFKITYGDFSHAFGPIYTDTVTVAGVSVSNQIFSAATTVSFSHNFSSIDG